MHKRSIDYKFNHLKSHGVSILGTNSIALSPYVAHPRSSKPNRPAGPRAEALPSPPIGRIPQVYQPLRAVSSASNGTAERAATARLQAQIGPQPLFIAQLSCVPRAARLECQRWPTVHIECKTRMAITFPSPSARSDPAALWDYPILNGDHLTRIGATIEGETVDRQVIVNLNQKARRHTLQETLLGLKVPRRLIRVRARLDRIIEGVGAGRPLTWV